MIKNTYFLDLEFRSPYPLKKGDFPGHAIAFVSVKRFKTLTTRSGEHSDPLITLECASLRELEDEIDRLHEELEEVRKVAKTKFALHDKREQERDV